MPNSIHTARWINQVHSDDWKIFLFSSTSEEALHPNLASLKIEPLWSALTRLRDITNRIGIKPLALFIDSIRKRFEKKFPAYRVWRLNRVIMQLRPSIIHSLEIQHAGYLTLMARDASSETFPQWIVTNWGSDIFLFGRLFQHKVRIKRVLENCDFYSCECERDVGLANDFGLKGISLPIFPNAGGFDLEHLEPIRHEVTTSKRKLIMLKGYQNWAGRALFGLRALERCSDILGGYTIAIFSPSPDVEIAAELFSEKTGIPTILIPNETSHFEILCLHARSRLSIGISISDAISTSLLEAIVMGSFPIQSCTACAEEWIEHGVSGMIVPPEDTDVIEMAIRTGLTDDELVDSSSNINWQTALCKLDSKHLKQKAINIYTSVLSKDLR